MAVQTCGHGIPAGFYCGQCDPVYEHTPATNALLSDWDRYNEEVRLKLKEKHHEEPGLEES